jgi:hypothetical protein
MMLFMGSLRPVQPFEVQRLGPRKVQLDRSRTAHPNRRRRAIAGTAATTKNSRIWAETALTMIERRFANADTRAERAAA